MFYQLSVNVSHLALDYSRASKDEFEKKWLKNFVNVNLFIELCERKTEMINPVVFYDDDESYIEKILLLEEDLMKNLKPHHTIIKDKKKKIRKIYKCIT